MITSISLYILLLIVLGVSILLALVTLPGIWIMIISGILYAYFTDFAYVGWTTILICIGLGVLAEIVEFFAGGAGAAKAGGSKRAIVGAVLGGILGLFAGILIPIPVIGSLLGLFIGTYLGAMIGESQKGSTLEKSRSVAAAATLGKFLGVMLKLPFALAIAITFAITAFPAGQVAAPATQPAVVLPATTAPASQPSFELSPATAPTTQPALP